MNEKEREREKERKRDREAKENDYPIFMSKVILVLIRSLTFQCISE